MYIYWDASIVVCWEEVDLKTVAYFPKYYNVDNHTFPLNLTNSLVQGDVIVTLVFYS